MNEHILYIIALSILLSVAIIYNVIVHKISKNRRWKEKEQEFFGLIMAYAGIIILTFVGIIRGGYL